MSVFNVELKKVVDDSYDIEMGYRLEDQLVEDLETGLLGKIRKFAVITDSNVLDLYAKPISEKLSKAGFKVELFVFPAGEKSKTRQTKAKIEDAMLEKGLPGNNTFCAIRRPSLTGQVRQAVAQYKCVAQALPPNAWHQILVHWKNLYS